MSSAWDGHWEESILNGLSMLLKAALSLTWDCWRLPHNYISRLYCIYRFIFSNKCAVIKSGGVVKRVSFKSRSPWFKHPWSCFQAQCDPFLTFLILGVKITLNLKALGRDIRADCLL